MSSFIATSEKGRAKLAPILALVVWLVGVQAYAQDGDHIYRLGTSGVSGNYCDVKAYNDDIAYYTNSFGLVVMDVSDPTHPHPARIIPTRGRAQGLFLTDSLLFLCDGYEGLRIYDVNDNPWNPREISHTTGPTNARGLEVVGHYAYLWQVRNSIGFIYDVSDPTHPEELSRTDFRGGESMRLFPIGDRMYALSATTPGTYWDITDRRNPDYIGTIEPRLTGAERGTEFDFARSLLFNYETIYLFPDALHADSISRVDEYTITSNKIVDTKLFMVGGDGTHTGMMLWNVSDARRPRRISSYFQPNRGGVPVFSSFLDIHDSRLYTTDGVNGTTIYDLRDEARPSRYGFYDNRGDFSSVAVSPDYIYAADRLNWQVNGNNSFRIHVYSRHPISSPEEVFDLELGRNDSVLRGGANELERPIIAGNILYCLTHGFLTGFTLEDPVHPAPLFIANQNQFGAMQDFVLDGTIAFGVSTYVYAIDFSDYRNPRLLSRIRCDQAQGGIACDEHYLYVLSFGAGLYIYNRDDERHLNQVALLELGNGGSANDILLYRDRAYLVLSNSTVIVNISDRQNPIITGQLRPPGGLQWRGMLSDSILLVSCQDRGVYAYSLADPDNPRQIGFYDTPGTTCQTAVQDGYLYAADASEIGVYDVSEITGWWAPALSDSTHSFGEVRLDTSSSWEFTIGNNARHPMVIYSAATSDSAFSTAFRDSIVLQPDEETTLRVTFAPDSARDYTDTLRMRTDRRELKVALVGRGLPLLVGRDYQNITKLILHSSYPSPFNSRTTIEWSMPVASDAKIMVYDTEGRLIERLASGRMSAGDHSVVWDAASKPAGVYLVRLEVNGFAQSRKAVVVK